MSKVITLNRPEGGAEADFFLRRRHNCKNAKAFRAALNDEYVDEMQFNVGLAGLGMPLYTPFVVESIFPCDVCGMMVRGWFQWGGSLVVTL